MAGFHLSPVCVFIGLSWVEVHDIKEATGYRRTREGKWERKGEKEARKEREREREREGLRVQTGLRRK